MLIFGKKYRVDYCGQKEFFKGAKDKYKEGDEVEVYFHLIATDTSYKFYLDGEEINVGYDEKAGIIVKFTMPPHDVTLSFRQRNVMLGERIEK